MANNYIAINKGATGRFGSDYTVGTASAAAVDFEVRMANPTADGKVPVKKDVIIALQNIIHFIDNNYDLNAGAVPLVQ